MAAKTYFNWSSGKDAAFAFYYLQQDPNFQIDQLVTTVNAHYERVSMHGLRKTLLERQAAAIGLPLKTIELPEQPTMEVYNQIMERELKQLQTAGYTHCGFGDIFLEDLRQYREAQLQPFGIKANFPIWQRDTIELLQEFIDLGFRAVVVCINGNLLDESFAGREIDRDFIKDLPAHVDPCGENGEFHTFCYDGPIFSQPIDFTLDKKVERVYNAPQAAAEKTIRFWFQDLQPIG